MPKLAVRPSTTGFFPSGSVVSGWTKNTKNPIFFEKREKSSETQKLKKILEMPKLAQRPLTRGL